MNRLSDKLLLKIFSNIHWLILVKLESVSPRWRRVMLDKSLRNIESVALSSLAKNDWKLTQAIRSLVVEKRKIISGLVIDVEMDPEILVSVMEIFTSCAAGHLKRLTTVFVKYRTLSDGFCSLVNLCVNLQVLELHNTHCADIHPVNLSGLIVLKELTGSNIQFRNCRAPNLTRLDYRQVEFDEPSESTDFLLMIFTAAENIERLILDDIWLTESDDVISITCQVPKLIRLVLSDSKLSGLTIDLAQSSSLEVVEVDKCRDSHLTNFDLSMHALASFSVGTDAIPSRYASFDEDDVIICADFVASAVIHPDRLCLLTMLKIHLEAHELFANLLAAISPFYVYTFNTIELNCGGPDWPLLPCGGGLTTLVKSSPALESLYLDDFSVDKQCLIDLIIARVDCSSGFNTFKFGAIDGPDFEFLSELYDALGSMDVSVMKWETICIHYLAKFDMRYSTNKIINALEDDFNIVVMAMEID